MKEKIVFNKFHQMRTISRNKKKVARGLGLFHLIKYFSKKNKLRTKLSTYISIFCEVIEKYELTIIKKKKFNYFEKYMMGNAK